MIPRKDRERLAPFCPDFAIEVKSPPDKLGKLEDKCARYVQSGAFETWLIDPGRKTVTIFRPGSKEFLQDVSSVSGSGALTGFTLDLTEVWRGLDDEALSG